MQTFIEIIIGVILAIGVIFIARKSGKFSVEKRLYASGLVIAAIIYVGFGLFSETINWKIIEVVGVPIYALFAWLGVKKSGYFLAFGWAFHVAWDAVLHGISTPFVPHWYIGLCIGFDLAVAGYIGFREFREKV
jgi:hypothetical protein